MTTGTSNIPRSSAHGKSLLETKMFILYYSVVRTSVVIWGCLSGIFYVLVSSSRPVSGGLKSVSIVEYYLKKAVIL